MVWSPNYIENSLYYEAWKTKFIEVFLREYPKLKKIFYTVTDKTSDEYFYFVKYYIKIFKTALKILKNKLKSNDCTNITFSSDIIFESYKAKLINNPNLWYEFLLFLKQYHIDNNCYNNFKSEYMTLLEDFALNIKPHIKNLGNKEYNYKIYDNTYCLWGISPKSYIKIINLFLKYESLKIVRISGSRTTPDFREFSDIDLIAEGTYTPIEYSKLQDEIEELNIPYIIDMNDILKETKPFIYRNIIRSNIFYKRQNYFSEENYVSILE